MLNGIGMRGIRIKNPYEYGHTLTLFVDDSEGNRIASISTSFLNYLLLNAPDSAKIETTSDPS